jgi:4-alpha-glucanotransferase
MATLAERASGVLLHPTSLPGGRLGDEARAFVDWLAAAGQSWWQVLPLTPPDEHGSPYKSASAFAGWNGLLEDPDAPVSGAEEDDFRARHAFWIGDWERFAGEDAVADQVRFEREWGALRAYAEARGVRLLGDVPIYVAPGSADHVAHPELFREGLEAGVPPDDYAGDGQHWGNPLYDWPALQRRGYRWWIERMRRTLDFVDAARIDHFRGFVAYWAIPFGESPREGTWRRGPGRAVFDAIARDLGGLPLVAEDLGDISPAVERLRDALGLPGMVVLVFGFDGDDPHDPHRWVNHAENRVAYVGTHDNDTALGWWEAAPQEARDAARAAMAEAGVEEADPVRALIRLALASRARTAIVTAQDLLGLGSEARMNTPGVEGGTNWTWRLEPGALTPALAGRLRAWTEASGRRPKPAPAAPRRRPPSARDRSASPP